MTLDEAIKHSEEMAEEQEKAAKGWHEIQVRKCELIPFAEMDYTDENECKECASEHRQLAEWLKELKDYRERIPSYEAGYNDAKREIALSGEYQRAYERGKKDAELKMGYISIDDVMSVFDDFMCGDVDEDGMDTFLEMLKDKAESEK